jgi:hypothetical protein
MAVITLTTQPVVDPQTFTPTFYLELGNELMRAFDQIATIIPKIVEAESATAKDVRVNLGVPLVFCGTAISAVEQLPVLAAATKLDPVKARNLLQFIEAFLPLSDKMSGLARRLRHALRAAKSQLGTDTLHVYRVAQGVASDQRSPVVEEHVGAMKRDLARKGLSKAEREARKEARFNEEVEKRLAARMKEVKALTA